MPGEAPRLGQRLSVHYPWLPASATLLLVSSSSDPAEVWAGLWIFCPSPPPRHCCWMPPSPGPRYHPHPGWQAQLAAPPLAQSPARYHLPVTQAVPHLVRRLQLQAGTFYLVLYCLPLRGLQKWHQQPDPVHVLQGHGFSDQRVPSATAFGACMPTRSIVI
jgi:hypothetical protein